MAGELELEDERTAKKRVRRGCVQLGVEYSFGQTANDELTDARLKLLECPCCGSFARPHVLWFDEFYEFYEFYDEETYGFAAAQCAVANASLCIAAETSDGVPVARRLAAIAERAPVGYF